LRFSIVVLTFGNDLHQRFKLAVTPLVSLALQTLLVGVVLTGFPPRRASARRSAGELDVPAGMSGDERPYFAGVAFFGTLAALIISVHALDMSWHRTRTPIDLNELPSGATQRFELTR
jgi:hypothetical protein